MESKKLAELLGIEPRYFIKERIGWSEISKNDYLTNKERYGNTIKEVLPDFEQPENFVKLLGLLINNSINVEFDFKHNKNHKNIVYLSDSDSEGENLTDAVINYINESVEYYEFDGVEEKIQLLKTEAQQVKWKY